MVQKRVHSGRVQRFGFGRTGERLWRVLAAVGAAAVPFLWGLPASAAVTAPDSTPTITRPHVNRNLVETGDVLVYSEYNLPYKALPSVDNVTIPADVMFIFRLMTPDGSTELGNITPYSSQTYGYGYNKGIVAWYFPASASYTWGALNIMRISQNPTYFPTPAAVDTVLPADAYTTLTAKTDNQAELATNLYYIGQDLEKQFNMTLFQSAGTRQVLTGEGEVYYRGAVSGLQALAPSLFLVQEVPLTTTTKEYTTEQFDTYEHRFDGTWVGDSMTATAGQIGTYDPSLAMALIAVLPLSVAAIVFSSIKFRRAEPGFVATAAFMLMAVLMGWMPKAIFASTYQATAIYSAFLVFYARG